MAIEISNLPEVLDVQHARHYHDTLARRVFSQTTTPLGEAIPIYDATDIEGGMPIWNPTGSGVNVELISVAAGYVSGTAAYGTVVLMARNDVGNQITNGSEITAFAETTPDGGLLGVSGGSRVRSSNTGTVTVSAGVAGEAVRTLFTINLEKITTTAHRTVDNEFDFNGTVIVPPGVLVWIANRVDSVALYAMSIVWKEIPI